MIRMLRTVFAVVLICLGASCAPARPPVPAGVVPKPPPVSVSEEQYGHQVLAALTQKWQLDYNHPRYGEVSQVVQRLTAAAHADRDPWHVYLLKADNIKNAAATRGNHVFVWTGMLDATKGSDELAAILSHEISHVLARHTDPDPNEQIKQMLVQVGAIAAGVAASSVSRSPAMSRTVADLASSLTKEMGSGLLVYPYSREREFEADQISLFLMADAGFNPQAAIDFWTRGRDDPAFGSSLAFFSTHPPAADRLEQLKKFLPDATARYQGKDSIKKGPETALQRPLAALPTPKNTTPPQNRPRRGASSLPPGDTFDMSGKPTAGAPQSAERTWIVTAPKTLLHEHPNSGSRAIGEFRAGAAVTAISESAEWVEIRKPDHGFLAKRTLEPRP